MNAWISCLLKHGIQQTSDQCTHPQSNEVVVVFSEAAHSLLRHLNLHQQQDQVRRRH